MHTQVVQDVLYAIICKEAPLTVRGPSSSYVPEDVRRVREGRQRFKKMTRDRKCRGVIDAVRTCLQKWAFDTHDNAEELMVSKEVLLFETVAAAVKISTNFIRRRIKEWKNEKRGNIARQVGMISPLNIFNPLKELRLGARQPNLWKSPLPNLNDQEMELVTGRLQLDKAWLQYFGDMELGALTPNADYISKTTSKAFMEVEFLPDATLLPSLSDIEQILRSTETDKAAGLDKMLGELLRCCPARMSTVLQPLFLKAILRGRQPIQWRGGLLIEALKKSGMEMTLSGHRSLVVGSVVGKAFHRFVRSRIIDKTEAALHDTHFGARRGGTVTEASHVAVLYETPQEARKRSSALLDMDVISAYYCVRRQLVWQRSRNGGPGHPEEHATLSAPLGILAETPADHRKSRAFQTTWSVRARQARHHRVLDEIEKELRQLDCQEVIVPVTSPACGRKRMEDALPSLALLGRTMGLSWPGGKDPASLWRRACSLATTMVRIFFECGLVPNLEKGKSEMMLTFRGSGSGKMQTAVFADGVRSVKIDLGHWGNKQLRLVTHYIHLGCALDRGASLKLEAQRRTSKVEGAFQERRRRLYQNKDIPLPMRGTLFTAMVESTMFNLGIPGQPWSTARPCMGQATSWACQAPQTFGGKGHGP